MKMQSKFTKEQVVHLKLAQKKNKNKNIDKRLRALLFYSQGMKRKEIADKTGFAATYISVLAKKYRLGGIEAITGNHYKGNRRNLSFDEEAKLIEGFKQKAAAGQVTSVRELKKIYEEATGKTYGSNNKGQIYRVLLRHNGRKVMPRSVHPKKATPEVILNSQKFNLHISTNASKYLEKPQRV